MQKLIDAGLSAVGSPKSPSKSRRLGLEEKSSQNRFVEVVDVGKRTRFDEKTLGSFF